ncbi:CHAT domain-containing protein [Paraburkholderia humisilvae]|uniref:CHAT domain-containing protein n=1 Tax=Paraburkholderia humisilvae TaxID=627669 RepID=A0A6J5EU27_9BURK|nr:CHAT domain-containing protein [Paraburkholderia humisilvae]CAB3770088.1 hypothetical protein LMG29542_06261 [Paraburkholderia humisilvae]
MTPTDSGRKTILLVSEDDEKEALFIGHVELLDDAVKDDFPEALQFSGAKITRKSYADRARDALNPSLAAAIRPVLIILDAQVREYRDQGPQLDDKPAIDFLLWLDTTLPDVPVLVVAPEPGEVIQRRVLGRRNTSLLCIGERKASGQGDVMAFAEALAGLALSGATKRRRYTIDVGLNSARYRVFNDRYQVISSSEIAYNDDSAIDEILEGIEQQRAPFDVRANQSLLRSWGKHLFNLLIKDTVGTHLVERLRMMPVAAEEPRTEVDLRFEIDLRVPEREKLFNLPLELVNYNRSFLCSRVPTARNIRFTLTGDLSTDKTVRPLADSCQVLFVKSKVSKTNVVKDEAGNRIRGMEFSKLENVDRELDTLTHYMTPEGKRRVQALTVIGDENPPLSGLALRDRLRDTIVEGEFDVVHFAGHSMNTGAHGGTYLILPGAPGEALAVKMASVARWLSEGGCHLMVLSSCEGASAVTAMETMKGGIGAVVGFRWNVDDDLCAEYFARFYRSYFWHGCTISESFRDACDEAVSTVDLMPTWASAVAVLKD